jgi:hypothetical protein
MAVTKPTEQWGPRLAWSNFRRRHQATARRAHMRRRSQHQEQSAVSAGRTERAAIQVLAGGKLELNEERWGRIYPLLPPQKPKIGRPGNDQRTLLAGMVWVIRTGARWREVPECYGAWQTHYACYQRWRKAGIWQQILDILQIGETKT